MSAFVGIDVSKATLDVAVRCDSHQAHLQVTNRLQGFVALHEWLQEFPVIERIGLEASGRYGEALAYWLVEQGYPVSYINPAQIHAFSQIPLHYNKTDKQDALLIAHFCELYHPDLWKPSNRLHRRLQQRFRRLKALEKMRQQERNRLQSGIIDEFVLAQIQTMIAHLDTLIQQTQDAIEHLIYQDHDLHHDLSLLCSIPGIGVKTAAVLLAELGDLRRFASPSQLVSYLGIAPKHFQSGTSVHRRSSISKQGNSHLRAALYMPALVAKSWNPPCQRFAKRLQDKGKPAKVIIVAVMRKLIHQIFGILNSGQPFDPDFELSS